MASARVLIDLVGRSFGRLLVLSRAASRGKSTMWRVRCACGTEKVVNGRSLRSGKTLSCGCLIRENRVAVSDLAPLQRLFVRVRCDREAGCLGYGCDGCVFRSTEAQFYTEPGVALMARYGRSRQRADLG